MFLKKNMHIFLIVCAGLMVYSNTFKAPFIFDDRINIVTNEALTDVGNFLHPAKLMEISAHSTNLKYAIMTRIVGYFTFALNYSVHGLNVTGYHIFNLAVHIVNSLLVYFLVIITFQTPYLKMYGIEDPTHTENDITTNHLHLAALGIALIFVCHPLQTQAVTYISQRFASLATLFYLSTHILYIKSRIARSATGYYYAAAIVLAVLAMLTKEISSTLFLTIALYEIMFLEGKASRRFYMVLPFFLISFIVPAILLLVQRTVDTVSNINQSMAFLGGENVLPRWHYFLTQLRVIVTYLRLLVFPVGQNFDYAYPVYTSLFQPVVLLSAALLTAMLTYSVYLYFLSRHASTKNRIELRFISFGLLWFFITLSVESSVIPIADVINEHRVYLPSVGFVIAIVFLIFLIQKQPGASRLKIKIALPMLITFVLSLGVAAFARNMVWRDPVHFWEDAVRKSPQKARTHTQLSIAYGTAGMVEESISEYQKAMSLNPDFMKSHGKLGVQQKEFERVLREARISSALKHDNNGVEYLKQGSIEEAIREFKASVDILPDYMEAHSHLGFAYMKTNRYEEAERECKTALAIQPQKADLHYNLGVILYQSGRMHDARKEFESAVELNPGDTESLNMLKKINGLN
jgi:protein O-mannosyl-transferase